jgi:hypothetical protein
MKHDYGHVGRHRYIFFGRLVALCIRMKGSVLLRRYMVPRLHLNSMEVLGRF